MGDELFKVGDYVSHHLYNLEHQTFISAKYYSTSLARAQSHQLKKLFRVIFLIFSLQGLLENMHERTWVSCHISHRMSKDHLAKKDKEIIYLQDQPDHFI